MEKKAVLLVWYLFPPISNIGAFRIIRFLKHFRESSWRPVVLTPRYASGFTLDYRLNRAIPAGTKVYRTGNLDLVFLWRKLTGVKEAQEISQEPVVVPVGSPQGMVKKIATFINRWFMIPDKTVGWWPMAVWQGLRVIRRENIRVIYSTSDPLSSHLVSLSLHVLTKRPFIAEFRDLWLDSPYFSRQQPTRIHHLIHQIMEHLVLKRAAHLVFVTRAMRNITLARHPKLAPKPSSIIYNCFDIDEHRSASAAFAMPGRFLVTYTGTLYKGRAIEIFLEGLAQFIRRQGLSPEQIGFRLVGASGDVDILSIAKKMDIEDYVEYVGLVPHAQVADYLQSSTILLLIKSFNDAIHIPGKLFEYLGSGKSILLLALPSEAAEIVRASGRGIIVNPTDVPQIVQGLAHFYKLFQEGNLGRELHQESDLFEAKNMTRELIKTLDAVAEE